VSTFDFVLDCEFFEETILLAIFLEMLEPLSFINKICPYFKLFLDGVEEEVSLSDDTGEDDSESLDLFIFDDFGLLCAT
jgi:hypothetical protein